jgi:hypothetical protein
MFEAYNPSFDERKYWAYGCNCHVLGDRPMSDPGFGPPVDELDTVCKAYKDCLKCVREEHGPQCIGEFIAYDYSLVRDGGKKRPVCNDRPGTCKRGLCECDAMFARKHVDVKDVFDKQYHYFWAPNGWEQGQVCPRASGPGNPPECCIDTRKEGPYKLYRANSHQCCPNGKLRPLGELCPSAGQSGKPGQSGGYKSG